MFYLIIFYKSHLVFLKSKLICTFFQSHEKNKSFVYSVLFTTVLCTLSLFCQFDNDHHRDNYHFVLDWSYYLFIISMVSEILNTSILLEKKMF